MSDDPKVMARHVFLEWANFSTHEAARPAIEALLRGEMDDMPMLLMASRAIEAERARAAKAADYTHHIRIYPIGCRGETHYEESFTGTDLEAEQRLSVVWNENTPADGSRFRAILRRAGERRHFVSIS